MKTCWPNLKGRRITQKRKTSKVAFVVVFVVVFVVTPTLKLDQYAAEMELEMEMETTAPGTWSCLVTVLPCGACTVYLQCCLVSALSCDCLPLYFIVLSCAIISYLVVVLTSHYLCHFQLSSVA
jgi:hypothetical protein